MTSAMPDPWEMTADVVYDEEPPTEDEITAQYEDYLTDLAVAHLMEYQGDAPHGSYECVCLMHVPENRARIHAAMCKELREEASRVETEKNRGGVA